MLGKGSDVRMFIQSWCREPHSAAPEREVHIHGLKILVRRRTSDAHVIDEIFRRKVYGEPPRGVVLDFGANIGAYTLYAGRTATRVYSFEPEESNFAQLQKNVDRNHALPISLFKKAVGGTRGTAHLQVPTINKGAASLVIERGAGTQAVEVISLDHALSLCGVTHVDMLKIDIEGSEYALFETASIHTLKKVGAIAMEIHRVPGKKVSSLISKLRDAGFRVHFRRTRIWPFGMRVMYASRPSQL